MSGASSLLMVDWLLSDQCNLKCKFCSPGQSERPRLHPKDVITTAQHLADLQIFTTVISGKEPLLHPLLFDAVKILSEGGVQVLLFTNGTLVSDSVVGELQESGVGAVQVSLDGNEATHDTLKGVTGVFKKSVEAVERLVNSDIPTGVCTTVSKENVGEITDIAHYVSRLGVKIYSIRWCMPCGKGSYCRETALSPEEWHDTLLRFLGLKNEVNMELVCMDPLLAPLTAPKLRPRADDFEGCGVGFNTCAIQCDGSVTPCAYLDDVAGNVTRRSLRETWYSPIFEKYRRKETMVTGKCRECEWGSLCGGGCKARSHEVYKDISKPDPLCWVNP